MNKKKNISDAQRELIETLANNELLVGSLYKIYADKFPKFKHFWEKLITDEKNHGTWLKTLLSDVDKGKLLINEDRFNAETIMSFTKYVKDLKDIALKEDFTVINALSYARDIESALIERGFFKVYETDSPILKIVLNDLEKVTTAHEKMVIEEWQKATNYS